ncbi:MAG: alkaline phosphatase [Thermodesulfobacteriota bacterium]
MNGAVRAGKVIITALVVTAGLCSAAQAGGQDEASGGRGPRSREAKNIILFIGDGMQLEHEIAASRYLHGRDFGLAWHDLGYRAAVTTWDVTTYNARAATLGAAPYSPESFEPTIGYDPALGGKRPFPADTTGSDAYFLTTMKATDSASAATAWATGHKTDDGNIAWLPGDPEGGALRTIAELVREDKHRSIGVVSTVPFTHATPAAHVSHNVSRNNYLAIADEIIRDVQPEVVIGGGFPASGNFRYLSESLYQEVKEGIVDEYVFVERAAGVDGGLILADGAGQALASGKKLFGLFGGADGNLISPVPADSPRFPAIARGAVEDPLLVDSTRAALKVLSADRDGFFLMVEQGDIDWANHANDFARMIGCVWDLDLAVRSAIDFVNQPGDRVDWSNTLLIVTSDHGNSYMRLVLDDSATPRLGLGDLPRQVANSVPVGGYTPGFVYPEGEITYGSGSHTNELVTFYARGQGVNQFARRQGAWYPRTQLLDNTQLFEAMAAASGLR